MRLLLLIPYLLSVFALTSVAHAGDTDQEVDLDQDTVSESEPEVPQKPEKPDGREEGGNGRDQNGTGEKPDQNGNGGGGKTNMPND